MVVCSQNRLPARMRAAIVSLLAGSATLAQPQRTFPALHNLHRGWPHGDCHRRCRCTTRPRRQRLGGSPRKDRYRGKAWSLQDPSETYIFSHQDAREAERGYADLGTRFPHAYHNSSDSRYYGGLRFTPAGDELTADFVRALIDNEAVGQRGETDVLAVSFSALDYVGHAFGTFSLEYEDQFRQVDRIIGALLEVIDQRIGLERTLVVLTGDHGADDIPEYQSRQGLDAGSSQTAPSRSAALHRP